MFVFGEKRLYNRLACPKTLRKFCLNVLRLPAIIFWSVTGSPANYARLRADTPPSACVILQGPVGDLRSQGSASQCCVRRPA